MNIPMTQAIERVFEHLPRILEGSKVCDACRDRTKCPQCAFCNSNHQSNEGR